MPEGKHSEQPTHLEITCRRVEAIFAAAGMKLAAPGPVPLIWDEHGGTFVMRLSGVQEGECMDPMEPPGIHLEVSLIPAGVFAAGLKEFAANQNLSLRVTRPPAGEFVEPVLLAAAHLPGHKLFAFCEKPQLIVRKPASDTLELLVQGEFKTRTLPSREADLVIHLSPAAMARVVSYILALVQETQARL